jgi:hypothetical protein
LFKKNPWAHLNFTEAQLIDEIYRTLDELGNSELKIYKSTSKKREKKFMHSKLNLNVNKVFEILNRGFLQKPSKNKTELIFEKLQMHSGVSGELFFRRALNGFILIDVKNGLVAKALDWEFEPNFLKNEYASMKICPQITNRMIKEFRLDNYDILISTFLPKSRSYSNSAWPSIFPRIISRVLENQRPIYRNFLQNSEKENNLYQRHSQSTKEMHGFDSQFDLLQIEIESLLELDNFLGISITSIPFVLAHGDLVPSNLLLSNRDSFLLIDWVNGGFHNFFYDLAIQEIYNPTSVAWSRFFQLDLAEISRTKLYSNGIDTYVNFYSKFTGKKLSIEILNYGLILSIKEFAFKNYLRHRNINNLDEGNRVLSICLEIVSTMKKSLLKGS